MASSRESSPADESSPASPAQLTPNSKVKALLASFDNDSDDEGVSESTRSILKAATAKKPTPGPTSLFTDAKQPSRNTTPQEPAEVSSTDDDEDIVRPKGRMAARMQATEPEVEKEVDNARERVKKMLMTRKQSPQPAVDSEDLADSDESETPIVHRKRKARVSRRSTPTSSPEKGSASPGLFVSPAKSVNPSGDASDSEDLPANPLQDDRFKALVAKKRQERLDKEAKEAAQKAKNMAERRKQAEVIDQDDVDDDLLERRLTQQNKPTRKASKKALEGIARETQRMSRNMQLTHDARTKKKITKADLFKKFNYKPVRATMEENTEQQATSSSPPPQSDVEMHETPPTSPASHENEAEKPLVAGNAAVVANGPQEVGLEDSPTLEEALSSSPPTKLDKGKGKAVEVPSPEPELLKKKPQFKQRPIRIRPPMVTNSNASALDDSDSDLEIITSKTPISKRKRLDKMFDGIPTKQAQESHSIQALRMLAHLKSPGKQNVGKNQKSSMTTTTLQVSLQQLARQQAAREKEEKMEALRAKGIDVQSFEDRQKIQLEVDGLMEARREADEIRQKEKADAKKERRAKGEGEPLGDSSDDEDWEESKADPLELSGSGSEDEEGSAGDASGEEDSDDEEDELAVDGEEQVQATTTNSMFDNEAGETDDDEAEAQLSFDEEMAEVDNLADDQEEDLPIINNRRGRKANIISDDEEEDQVAETPSAPRIKSPTQLHTDSPAAPNSVLRSATKTFIPGLPVAGPAGLGLTQIFAGTMDDSQIEPFDGSPSSPNPISQMDADNDSMAFLRRLPAPDLPPFVPTMEDSQDVVIDSQPGHIPESQPAETQTQGVQLGFSQSQVHGFDSLVDPTATQFSEFPEATQDVGFQHMTPIVGRFMDPPSSTIDTVVLGRAAAHQETPIAKKKGKLRRRARVSTFSDEEDAGEPAGAEEVEDEFEISANIFDVMRKASREKVTVVDDFDKKTSKAKEMVHEQADESEDEYAGLGGASDDDDAGEDDEYVKEMIDDEAGKEVDESKLAAFFADRERAKDEKQVEKLYNDITKGMLRRKRGADYDLSDSDDGGEARKRMKRKEFAKMRKALLADERIGKIAENPKRQAFLRAIEDRGSADELDFLDDFAEHDAATDSQSRSQGEDSQQRVPDSQPDATMGPPKRKSSGVTIETEPRAPPHLRRSKLSKKPSNLSEIRESLSSLIEEPNAMAAPESGSDSDDELAVDGEANPVSEQAKGQENRDPFASRRKVQVIDRISLKRASSSSLSNSTRFAFAASSAAPGFKVPPLPRRNSSLASTASTTSTASGGMSATERMAGGAGSDGIKRGGGKNSGVNYFARESERRAAVTKTEKRREKKMFKGAEGRRVAVGGLLGGGKFE